MKQKDYTKFANKEKEVEKVEVINEEVTSVDEALEETKEEIIKTPEVEETIETSEVDETQVTESDESEVQNEQVVVVEGTVTGCARLNVRKEANKESQAIYILDKGSSVMVDLDNSTEDFYKIYTIEIEGYCVKEFIEIK